MNIKRILIVLALFSLCSCSKTEDNPTALFERHVTSPIPESVRDIVVEQNTMPDLVFVAGFRINPSRFGFFRGLREFKEVGDRNSAKLVSAIHAANQFAEENSLPDIDLNSAQYFIGSTNETEPYTYHMIVNEAHSGILFVKLGF